MTVEHWMTFSLAFQLTNIESELARAESLEKKGDLVHRDDCLVRALDLIRLTVHVQPGRERKIELNRLSELLTNIIAHTSHYTESVRQLRQLLMPFAVRVAAERGV